MQYEIKKVSTSACPNFDPSDFDDHVAGSVGTGDHSLPIDYTVKGRLMDFPEVDSYFEVARHERNGVKAFGIMTSSLIKEVIVIDKSEFYVETENSIYKFTTIS